MNKNTKKSLLINPIVSRQLDETHRAATPLELFYDLIYVVAIAFLAGELHHALSAWHHVGQAIGLYFFGGRGIFTRGLPRLMIPMMLNSVWLPLLKWLEPSLLP